MTRPADCSICGRKACAILTVHLANGAIVAWCGACVDKVRERVRAERQS